MAESNPTFSSPQTVSAGCGRWVKGRRGNGERWRAAEREGKTDRWVDGLNLCKKKALRGDSTVTCSLPR